MGSITENINVIIDTTVLSADKNIELSQESSYTLDFTVKQDGILADFSSSTLKLYARKHGAAAFLLDVTGSNPSSGVARFSITPANLAQPGKYEYELQEINSAGDVVRWIDFKDRAFLIVTQAVGKLPSNKIRDQFLQALTDRGIRAKHDSLKFYAQAVEADALEDQESGNFDSVNNGVRFIPSLGFKGSGETGEYLDTGFEPLNDATLYLIADGCYWVYVYEVDTNADRSIAGGGDASDTILKIASGATDGDVINWGINVNDVAGEEVSEKLQGGALYAVVRDSAGQKLYRNGVLIAEDTTAALSAFPAGNIYELAFNGVSTEEESENVVVASGFASALEARELIVIRNQIEIALKHSLKGLGNRLTFELA